MSPALLTHAAASLRVAGSRGNRAQAAVLVLSAGFGLFLLSAAVADRALGLLVLVLALTAATVPLWRGVLWTPGPRAPLPLSGRLQAATEALCFALLALLPAAALLAALFLATTGPRELGQALAQLGLTALIFLPAAAGAGLLRPRQAPLVVWVLVALPGLAGTALGLGIAADGPPLLLELTVLAVGIALVGGTLQGTLWLASALAVRLEPGGKRLRPGRADRLAHDTRRQLVLSLPLVVLGTAGAWLLLSQLEARLAGISVDGAPGGHAAAAGFVVVLPLLPRAMALVSQLGVSLQLSVEQSQSWRLLPVDPRDLRRSLAALALGPLLVGTLTDLVAVALLATPLTWLPDLAEVMHFATGCLALCVGLMLWRLPRRAPAPDPG